MAKPIKRLSRSTMKKVTSSTLKNATIASKPKAQSWFFGLLREMNNPESKLEEDDKIIVIKDKYPKARFHYLILPKTDISEISKVSKDDLTILKHMETIAMKYVDHNKDHEFIVGYHAVPSMHRLHLHVISTDFDSPCLKTKQHWNSFNTPFFLPSKDVRKQIEDYGGMKIDKDKNNEYLKRNLKCHKCLYIPNSMPDLKKHILQHVPRKDMN